MHTQVCQTLNNRAITVDFHNETPYFQLLGDGEAFVAFVMAFLLSVGFQLTHKATCRGGACLTRHSYYARVRLGRLPVWRLQRTTCKVVFTVRPRPILPVEKGACTALGAGPAAL
jgi:hypothetical protein